MAPWAVFDVDGTLLPGTSMEKLFLFHAAKQRIFPLRNFAFQFLNGLVIAVREGWKNVFKKNKMYLKGVAESNIIDFAQSFFQQKIIPSLSAVGLNTIEHHRQHGFKIILISGSPIFLVSQLQKMCRPDYIIATELEIINNCYTGKIAGLHPYGQRKRDILLGIQKKLNIDFSTSIVFADHHSDVHHMELFGSAVAINPTAKLKKIARLRKWKIERW